MNQQYILNKVSLNRNTHEIKLGNSFVDRHVSRGSQELLLVFPLGTVVTVRSPVFVMTSQNIITTDYKNQLSVLMFCCSITSLCNPNCLIYSQPPASGCPSHVVVY